MVSLRLSRSFCSSFHSFFGGFAGFVSVFRVLVHAIMLIRAFVIIMQIIDFLFPQFLFCLQTVQRLLPFENAGSTWGINVQGQVTFSPSKERALTNSATSTCGSKSACEATIFLIM